jgi:hypothetical protein
MATDKVGLRTVEEFMEGYTPIYQPIYPLFLGKSQSYSEEAGKAELRRVSTIGDIRTKHITPKDTEIKQIAVNEAKKTFKKYFLANQFMISNLQDQQGVEDVVSQVLDEHQTQMDELFLLGEGTSNSTMVNNSLFWSDDSNYILESSTEVQKDVANNYLYDMHSKVLTTATKADRVSGRKVLMFYGTLTLPLFNSLYTTAVKPFKSALSEVLGNNYQVAQIPSGITPSGANGWLVANLDMLKLHYTVLPALNDEGDNNEKMYYWFNFLMGSCMLECLASGAVIRQPATLQA